MIQLAFIQHQWDQIRRQFFTDDPRETAAYVLLHHTRIDDHLRLTAREVLFPAETDYAERLPDFLSVKPAFINTVSRRAEKLGCGILVAHSHPMQDLRVGFSPVDNEGEERELRFFSQMLDATQPLASLVLGQRGWAARAWSYQGRKSSRKPIDEVVIIGHNVHIMPERQPGPRQRAHERQQRALGAANDAKLATSKILIVGGGGTGSACAEQLARLGVAKLVILDDDDLEDTNLSRVYGSRRRDIGRPKVKVLKMDIGTYSDTIVDAVAGRLENNRSVAASVDLILVCTDTHLSRAVANELSYRLHVPLIDLGTKVIAGASGPKFAVGQVTRVGPGRPCLQCLGTIDLERVRMESLSDEEREALRGEGYVQGAQDPDPSVIHYNTTVAAWAVTMALDTLTGCGGPSHDGYRFDLLEGEIRAVAGTPQPECICHTLIGRGAPHQQ